jgi:hypothetical protein
MKELCIKLVIKKKFEVNCFILRVTYIKIKKKLFNILFHLFWSGGVSSGSSVVSLVFSGLK